MSDNDRARLAESMLESLHEWLADVESAWVEEIERRSKHSIAVSSPRTLLRTCSLKLAAHRESMKSDLRKLPLGERIRLVEDLCDSIAPDQNALPLTAEQRADLDRRLDAYEVDGDPGRPAEDVIAEIREEL